MVCCNEYDGKRLVKGPTHLNDDDDDDEDPTE